jgi:hypothetical protein
MSAAYELLFDEYFPIRLYAEHKRGIPLRVLARLYSAPADALAERIEAARLLIEKQIRIEANFDLVS